MNSLLSACCPAGKILCFSLRGPTTGSAQLSGTVWPKTLVSFKAVIAKEMFSERTSKRVGRRAAACCCSSQFNSFLQAVYCYCGCFSLFGNGCLLFRLLLRDGMMKAYAGPSFNVSACTEWTFTRGWRLPMRCWRCPEWATTHTACGKPWQSGKLPPWQRTYVS